MDGLERLLARCIALITLKPQNLITLIERLLARCIALITLKPHNLITLKWQLYSVLCSLYSITCTLTIIVRSSPFVRPA